MLELSVHAVANGGDGVARGPNGQVVFVSGALPGEVVTAHITEQRKRFARAHTIEVRSASPDRVDPACTTHADGCGGCDLRHLAPVRQPGVKRSILADALQRLGGVHDVDIVVGPSGPADGYRTTVRCGVTDGRAAYRRRRSHDQVVVQECHVAHPMLGELLVEGRFGEASEVTLRCGAATGDRLAVVAPTAAGVVLPDGVRVVGVDELEQGRRAWFHEEIAGCRLRVSAQSFFQAGRVAAEMLVEAVGRALALEGLGDGSVIDLYAGIGLFSATLLADRPVVAVERSPSAVADQRVNLDGLDARCLRVSVEKWRPTPAVAVVADPARAGLGRGGVDKVVATGASVVVLVGCDAGAFARAAGLLTAAGYQLASVELVDCFPQTSQVEVVARFELET